MVPGEASDLVVVGRVRKPHGVRGEALIEVLSDEPGRFLPGSELILRAGETARILRVVSARPHRGGLLVSFDGVEDREEIAALRGADLAIPADAVGPAPEGSYYYFDLVGRPCRDRRSGDLGVVAAVHEDGGGLVLEIRGAERTVLVPFVREYLVAIHPSGGSIDFDLPEGLVDTCASPS